MAHITLETTIAAPIGTVFEILRTPARRPEWMTNLHEVRNVTGHGLHDSWEYTYTMLGRPFTGKIAFRELEVPRYMKQLGGMITDKLFIERQNERQMRTALENLKHLVEHDYGAQAQERGA